MSSWVSHFTRPPDSLTVLGMNADELAANPQARAWVVHDLNAEPTMPFAVDGPRIEPPVSVPMPSGA